MNRVTVIDLEGQATPFRMHEDAYEALKGYLEQARARLADDPDAADVLTDLERSIGDRLAARRGAGDRILALADVSAVLQDVGQVGGEAATAPPPPKHPRKRKLYRITEGQALAGVCTGMAAYTQTSLDGVRWTFVLLALVTAGVFALVYLALTFILPVTATRDTWVAELDEAARARETGA